MIKTRILKTETYKGKTIRFSSVYITGGDRAVKAETGSKSAIGRTKKIAFAKLKKKINSSR